MSDRSRILIVEDNPDTAFLMESVLEQDYEVSVATDGEQALRRAEHDGYDLVLMDINLGRGPSGAEVLQRLRAMPRFEKTPVAAVTAYALPGDRERFLEKGFDTYLQKPFTADELYALVASLLAGHRNGNGSSSA